MKKEILITICLGLMVCFSCGSPNKEKTTTSSSEEKVTTSPESEPAAPQDSAASPGEKLFAKNNCITCHKADTKLVGPPLKDIAAAYYGNKEGLKAFLKDEARAIVDPSQESVMHPQVEITKNMPPEQLDQIIDFILSHQ